MDNRFQADCGIVGGGAAGLAAAVFLSRLSGGALSVLLLEKGARVGKKLLATGNGTCNLSNTAASSAHYYGADPAFAAPALQAFPPEKTTAFFASLGLECHVRENGRIYPLCAQASAVLDCLRLEAAAAGVREECGGAVTAVIPERDGFLLQREEGDVRVRRVLLCPGGAAAPSLGGTAQGYGLLTALGHTRTPLFPSIVQVRTDPAFVKAAKGIRVDGEVAFLRDGRMLAQERGEILFTEYGLSGPAVMQISRCVGDWERRPSGRMEAALNLLPDRSEGELAVSLKQRTALPGRTMGDLLTGLLPKRLGQTVLRAAGYGDFTAPVSSLQEQDCRRIARGIADWRLAVKGTQGMGGAQVTAGGISTREFDPETMESRKVPGLYAAGEVLDVDGDCGGYNLQWAWASAYAAAKAMVLSLQPGKAAGRQGKNQDSRHPRRARR